MPHIEIASSGIKTTIVSGATTYSTATGALEIIMKNTGGAPATYTGNLSGSVALTLAVGQEVSLRMTTTKGKGSVIISAAGTTVEIIETI